MSPPAGSDFRYDADELQLFAHATNWKAYWSSQLAPFVKGDLLEVGSGIGNNTDFLRPLCVGRHLSLEPDARLAYQSQQAVQSHPASEVRAGTVASLSPDERFDTAVYIDVLEHIGDDVAELTAVASHIRPGGHIIALCPAHQILFSPFDKALGHCRRYSRSSLAGCTPPGARLVRIAYLDSLGWILSLGNRAFLRQRYPTLAQILFWDRKIIPLSRRVDSLSRFHIGKSILGVWQIEALGNSSQGSS